MSNWELIGYDRATGLRKYIGDHPDDPDGVLIAYDQDKSAVQQILDRNKAGQAEGRSRMGDMEKAAEIPTIVMFEWLTKYGVDFWNPNHREGVKRLLNSSDYRYLKCKNIII